MRFTYYGMFQGAQLKTLKNIAFIPRSLETKIDGINHTSIYDIYKGDNHNYYMNDTVQVVGDFGIALNIIDELDEQTFKYGIYSIDLFIDF